MEEQQDDLEARLVAVSERLPNFKHRCFQLFHEIGPHMGGRVRASDVSRYLHRHEVFLNESALQRLVRSLGESRGEHEESWNFSEFLHWMLDEEEQLWHTWSTGLDSDRNGEMDLPELLATCHAMGIKVSEEEGRAMLKHADLTVSDTITYGEFYRLMLDYEMLHPGVRLGHPSDALEMMLKALRRRATNIVVDDGTSAFMLDDYTGESKARHLIAAFMAASVTRTVTAPLDRLRCMLQVPVAAQQLTGTAKYSLSVKDAVRQAVDRGGYLSLWRGNGLNVARVVPEVAVRSFLFEHMKLAVTRVDDSVDATSELLLHHRFLAGVLAATGSQALFYPMEVLKTQLQLDPSQSFLSAARNTLTQRGIFGLYRGLCPSAIRLASDVALYEMSKYLHMQYVHPWFDPLHQLPSIPVLLGLGTVSTSIAQVVTYPFLLVRTRMQALGAPGMVATARNVLREEGVRGLYRGLAVNAVKTIPTVSLTFSAYEVFKRNMGIKTCY